ncbi:MAG: hypothetical protein DRJ52_03080 [Thermoprotei archaeon]|nr:MAG: hypothetical protein DRJ52_03080 [Thermoprotei archaeon]RLE96769.1 MAG: hypothetical protein DRJ63_10070 [Thermoprotei archaeon]
MEKIFGLLLIALLLVSIPMFVIGAEVKEVSGTIAEVTDTGLKLSTDGGVVELFCRGVWVVFTGNNTRFKARWVKIKDNLSPGTEVSASYIEREVNGTQLKIAVKMKIGNYTLVRAGVLKRYLTKKRIVRADGVVKEVGENYIKVEINGTIVRLNTKGAWVVRGSWSSVLSPLSSGDRVHVIYLKLKNTNIALLIKNYDKNVVLVRHRPRK